MSLISDIMVWLWLLLYLHASSSHAYKEEIEPLSIKITSGTVAGINMLSRKNRTFSAFRGIPYAKPPIGPLRFKEPKEPEPWNNTLKAFQDPPKCAQKNYLFGDLMVEGSEDCLYINVYTPKLNSWQYLKNPLPVMVFIHWGGFFTGSSGSDYLGPEYLMDKDIVLVTFNYRLGVLGFYSTYDDASPGNFGLKDQNLALRWVQKNIKNFGGDKHKVTLFGQSAGGSSVHYQMLRGNSRHLFHRAISESGTALALWAQPIDREIVKEISIIQGKLVGCGENIANTSDLVECIRKVPVEILLNSGDAFKFFSIDPLSVYQPVVETKTRRNPNPFLTKHPLEYIKDGNFLKIPWIVGLTSDDGLVRSSALWSQELVWSKLVASFDELMPKMMALNLSVQKKDIETIWEKIKNFYFAKKGESYDRYDIMRGLTDLYSDRSFHYSTYQATLLHSKMGHKPIWFFNFGYKGQHSYKSLFSGVNDTASNYTYSASHCDDLLYLFKSSAFFPTLSNCNDQKMIDYMVELWTNFATNTNATPSLSNSIIWDPISNWKEQRQYEIIKKINYLDITGIYTNDTSISFQMKTGIHSERLQFWEHLPLYENIQSLDQNHIDL